MPKCEMCFRLIAEATVVATKYTKRDRTTADSALLTAPKLILNLADDWIFSLADLLKNEKRPDKAPRSDPKDMKPLFACWPFAFRRDPLSGPSISFRSCFSGVILLSSPTRPS